MSTSDMSDFTKAKAKKEIVDVKPHHVFSLSQKARNNLTFLDEQRVVFLSGNYCVVQNIHQGRTEFIPGPKICQQEKRDIQAMAISPDRRYLAVSESGVQVFVYDLQTKQCTQLKMLMSKDYGVQQVVCMAFSTDSKYLLCQTGGPEWTLFYVDREKDEVIASVNTTSVGTVSQVSFNPGNNTQICVIGNHIFEIFQLDKDGLRKISSFKMDSENITSHGWLSEDQIVLGTKSGELLLLKDGELHRLTSPFERVNSNSSSTAALPHITVIRTYSKGFACAGSLGKVCLYEKTEENDYIKATEIRIPRDPCSNEPQEIIEMCLSLSEETLAICTHQGQIYHANLTSAEPSQSKKAVFKQVYQFPYLESITDLSVCYSKTLFATCSKDKTVRIWDYKTKSLELKRRFPEEPTCISLHPNGLSILVGFSNKICLMNVLVDRLRIVQKFNIKDCSQVVFSHGGSMFAAVSENQISIVHIRTGKIVKLNDPVNKVQSVIWCKADHHMLSCGVDGTINEWSVMTGSRTENKRKMCTYIDVTLSDSSESIFSIGDHMLYEFKDGEVVREVASPDTAFTAIAMTHSRMAVFVGTAAGTIRVMQLPLQEEISWTEYQAHSGPITKMVVTPDDQYLLSASEDGSLVMWSITDQDGCKLNMVKEISFTEDVLCSPAFLKRKDQAILDLQSEMQSQKLKMKYKLKHARIDYEKKLDKVQESYQQEIESLTDQIQKLYNEKEEQKIFHEMALAEMREEHAKELKEQKYHFENELHKASINQAELRLHYDQKMFEQEETRYCTTLDMKRNYDKRIQQQQEQIRGYEKMLKELQEKFDSEFKGDFVQHAQELQEEKEINKTLQEEKELLEKQLMVLWKVKGEIQHQYLEISQLEANIAEINSEKIETIKELQQKINKQEEELCTERQRVRDLRTYVQRIKSDIINCSSYISRPQQLMKHFVSLYQSHISEKVETSVLRPWMTEQVEMSVSSSVQNQAVKPETLESDCRENVKEHSTVQEKEKNSEEMLNEMPTDSTAELYEIYLRYEQQLQAEKETCRQLKNELKIMEQQMMQFWRIKEEIQQQNLEINMLKEEVQSLHGHEDFSKTFKKLRRKQTTVEDEKLTLEDIVQMHENSKIQTKSALISIHDQLDKQIKGRKTRQTDKPNLEQVKNSIDEKKLFLKKLESEVNEINGKHQQSIHKLKEKLKEMETELSKEKERAGKTNVMLDSIKADIQTCSNFTQYPIKLKEQFIKLHKKYIEKEPSTAVPTVDKKHQDRTRQSTTTKTGHVKARPPKQDMSKKDHKDRTYQGGTTKTGHVKAGPLRHNMSKQDHQSRTTKTGHVKVGPLRQDMSKQDRRDRTSQSSSTKTGHVKTIPLRQDMSKQDRRDRTSQSSSTKTGHVKTIPLRQDMSKQDRRDRTSQSSSTKTGHVKTIPLRQDMSKQDLRDRTSQRRTSLIRTTKTGHVTIGPLRQDMSKQDLRDRLSQRRSSLSRTTYTGPVKAGLPKLDHRDRTRLSSPTTVYRVGTARNPPKTRKNPVRLPPLPSPKRLDSSSKKGVLKRC